MFVWHSGTRKLRATIRPPGYEYRHKFHQGHTCRVATLEIRDVATVVLLLPLQALEEVDESHALAELFEDLSPWMRFQLWLYGQGYQPNASLPGVTGAKPTKLTEREERILRGEGLKLENLGLVDMDYVKKLPIEVKAWLARALEHLVENRWRYDGQDLVKPGSPMARSIYAAFEARRRCYVVVPERPKEPQTSYRLEAECRDG